VQIIFLEFNWPSDHKVNPSDSLLARILLVAHLFIVTTVRGPVALPREGAGYGQKLFFPFAVTSTLAVVIIGVEFYAFLSGAFVVGRAGLQFARGVGQGGAGAEELSLSGAELGRVHICAG